MMKITLGKSLVFIALLNGGSVYGGTSSCLDCHGNAESMKALVSMPVISSAEGEG